MTNKVNAILHQPKTAVEISDIVRACIISDKEARLMSEKRRPNVLFYCTDSVGQAAQHEVGPRDDEAALLHLFFKD